MTTQNILTKESFFFRAVKGSDGKVIPFKKTLGADGKEIIIDKRPEFVGEVPYIAPAWIYEQLASETLEAAKKERLLKYLSDLHNNAVYAEAQKQIAAAIKTNSAIELSQAVFNQEELDFWALAFKEPIDRKQFSDELIAAAIEDFVAIGTAQFKRANGDNVPAENILAAAREIFADKFKSTKTDKVTLAVFQKYLAQWFAGSSNQASFGALAANLQDKIDTYLAKDETSKIGKFG